MRDLSQLPLIDPDVLLSTEPLPPPPGPARLALGAYPEQARTTMLRECFARIGFRYEMDRINDVPFEADLALNMLPELLIMTGKLHGSRNRRTRALVEGDADDAVLLVNLRGPHLIEQDGKELVLGDGEAVLVSSADPSSFTHRPPGDVLGMRVPRSRLAPLLHDAERRFMKKIPRGTPALTLLTKYVGLTWEEGVAASPELKHLMATHIYDLMAVAVGATRDAEAAAQGNGLHAARLGAIKQDIAMNLDQPALSVTDLAARHACTPRFVQRLFEAEGSTFTRYLLVQRLERAYRMLMDPQRRDQKISAVAFDCGFGDVSYFNRAFRQHFGAVPSDIRVEKCRNVSAGSLAK